MASPAVDLAGAEPCPATDQGSAGDAGVFELEMTPTAIDDGIPPGPDTLSRQLFLPAIKRSTINSRRK